MWKTCNPTYTSFRTGISFFPFLAHYADPLLYWVGHIFTKLYQLEYKRLEQFTIYYNEMSTASAYLHNYAYLQKFEHVREVKFRLLLNVCLWQLELNRALIHEGDKIPSTH